MRQLCDGHKGVLGVQPQRASAISDGCFIMLRLFRVRGHLGHIIRSSRRIETIDHFAADECGDGAAGEGPAFEGRIAGFGA